MALSESLEADEVTERAAGSALEIQSRRLGQLLQGLQTDLVGIRLPLADHQPASRLQDADEFFARRLSGTSPSVATRYAHSWIASTAAGARP
jgi:hypothetical protein